MCGLAGIFTSSRFRADFGERQRLASMLNSQSHRGPDGMGLIQSDYFVLGLVRLSIQDRENGMQPWLSTCGRYILVFNGEVFNFLELAQELRELGREFKTNCDTEVLCEGISEWGLDKCVTRLNGQFSFALLDNKWRKLSLVRDRVGVRPLYYSQRGDITYFSSTIGSLLHNPEIPREFNWTALIQTSMLWTTIGSTTYLKEVKSVEPGKIIEISNNAINSRTYWDLPIREPKSPTSIEHQSEEVYTLLEDSVRLQTRSDVGFSNYLSGGLDSSAIQSILVKQHSNLFNSYSVRFVDKYFDETTQQRLISNHTDVSNRSVEISDEDVAAVFPDVISHTEQPIFRTAPAPMYHLARLARDSGEKVVISGEGADEIFWGYSVFKENKLRSELINGMSQTDAERAVSSFGSHLPQFSERLAKNQLNFYRTTLADPLDPLFTHRVRISNSAFFSNFISKDSLSNLDFEDVRHGILQFLPIDLAELSALERTQYIEMKTLLPNYLLSSQGDRMTMASSIEGRYPFLDHRLIEAAWAMPNESKLNNLSDKFILRRSFNGKLPESVIRGEKYPYRAPEGRALVQNPFLLDYLSTEAIHQSGTFDSTMVARLVSRHKAGVVPWNFKDNSAITLIITTLLFESWLRKLPYFHKTDMGTIHFDLDKVL